MAFELVCEQNNLNIVASHTTNFAIVDPFPAKLLSLSVNCLRLRLHEKHFRFCCRHCILFLQTCNRSVERKQCDKYGTINAAVNANLRAQSKLETSAKAFVNRSRSDHAEEWPIGSTIPST